MDTPAYGLKTPLGSFTIASSFWSSTSFLRSATCALVEPNSTPSGTMTAARPPGWSNRRNRARNSSSVFLVLTTRSRSSAVVS